MALCLPHSLLRFALHPDRLRDAWKNTPTKWYPLPIGVGAVLLAVIQFRKQNPGLITGQGEGILYTGAGEAVRISGPWQVCLSAFPFFDQYVE